MFENEKDNDLFKIDNDPGIIPTLAGYKVISNPNWMEDHQPMKFVVENNGQTITITPRWN